MPGSDDIFGNNCAGSDYDLVADRDREDGGIGSDTDAVTKFSLSPELRLSRRSAGHEEIVNKHRAMGNEAVVSNRDQIANERVGLNSATFANGRSFLYLNKWSYKGLISDSAPIEIDWLHDGDVLAECYIDNPCMPYFWFRHKLRNCRSHSNAPSPTNPFGNASAFQRVRRERAPSQ